MLAVKSLDIVVVVGMDMLLNKELFVMWENIVGLVCVFICGKTVFIFRQGTGTAVQLLQY